MGSVRGVGRSIRRCMCRVLLDLVSRSEWVWCVDGRRGRVLGDLGKHLVSQFIKLLWLWMVFVLKPQHKLRL